MPSVVVEGRPHTVLVTGAAGQVGTAIRPFLRSRFAEIHLTDVRDIPDVQANERFTRADLGDQAALGALMQGTDAIMHLAGHPPRSPFSQLTSIHADVVDRLLDSASAHGVQRVALASTMHVLGLYRRDESIGPASVPRSDSHYAAAKVLMEQVGALHASRGDLRVASVRIGCLKDTREESEPGGWIGPADLAGIFELAVTHAGIHNEILHAVAEHAGDDVGQRLIRRTFGYDFRERGLPYAKALERLPWWYPHDSVARQYRGGEFASATLASRTVSGQR